MNPTISCCSKRLFFLFLLLLPFSELLAQEDFSVFYEPEISVKVGGSKPWSFNFALSNREAVYVDEDSQFRALFLDFSHFTNYNVGFYGKLSLGLKYRFLELFDKTTYDEIRITEQYSYARKYNNLKTAHRLRFEQRFRKNTSYRARYRFSIEFPLKGQKIDVGEFFLDLKTESLWSFQKAAVPEFDQRLGADLAYQLSQNTEISIGLEYQYEDYFHDPQTELFVLTGVSVSM